MESGVGGIRSGWGDDCHPHPDYPACWSETLSWHPVHHSASRRITAHHSASQHITAHHSDSQHITAHHGTSQHITTHHSASPRITTHHSDSQHITARHSAGNAKRRCPSASAAFNWRSGRDELHILGPVEISNSGSQSSSSPPGTPDFVGITNSSSCPGDGSSWD